MRVLRQFDEELVQWIHAQPLFFVATAPSRGVHVNVSPRGLQGTLAVLPPSTLLFIDCFGSGIETIAHLNENGRICVMVCSFDKTPAVWRVHGHGRVHGFGEETFERLVHHFDVERRASYRSIVEIDVFRIGRSCGLGVPQMTFVAERPGLPKDVWDNDTFRQRILNWNKRSLDGLPGVQLLDAPRRVVPIRSRWTMIVRAFADRRDVALNVLVACLGFFVGMCLLPRGVLF